MLNLFKFRKTSSNELFDRVEKIKQRPIPSHIAIIMDGNGRWAKKRSLPRIAGHHEGMKKVQDITMIASKLKVETLTLYAFSTENWKRPKDEVDYLMNLPEQYLNKYLPKLINENVRISMIGYIDKLPTSTQKAVRYAMNQTKNNTGLNLNFALNYGSRAEIIDAVKNICKDVQNGTINANEIDDNCITQYLMTKSMKDPDLLIRTSGEIRLSNFLLWQLAYSELWFTDVLWPDFQEKHLLDAIDAYQNRSRRFGGLSSEESKK